MTTLILTSAVYAGAATLDYVPMPVNERHTSADEQCTLSVRGVPSRPRWLPAGPAAAMYAVVHAPSRTGSQCPRHNAEKLWSPAPTLRLSARYDATSRSLRVAAGPQR